VLQEELVELDKQVLLEKLEQLVVLVVLVLVELVELERLVQQLVVLAELDRQAELVV